MILNESMPLNWVSKKMLGHSDPSITLKIYADYWDDQTKIDSSKFDFLDQNATRFNFQEKIFLTISKLENGAA